MIGTIVNWNGGPVAWGFAVLALGVFYYIAWRRYRLGRVRQPYDRHRERQRREYWGWE